MVEFVWAAQPISLMSLCPNSSALGCLLSFPLRNTAVEISKRYMTAVSDLKSNVSRKDFRGAEWEVLPDNPWTHLMSPWYLFVVTSAVTLLQNCPMSSFPYLQTQQRQEQVWFQHWCCKLCITITPTNALGSASAAIAWGQV